MSPALFFDIFLSVCAPIFFVVGLGWLLDKRFGFHLETLVKLNIYLMVPAFIFTHVVGTKLSGGDALHIIFFTVTMVSLMFLASVVASRWLRLNARSAQAMKLATMFYNSGNFGLPLVTLAFGNEAAAVQVYVLATMNVCTFTVGLFLAHAHGESGSPHRRALLSVLRQPTLYAVLSGILCKALHLDLQSVKWLWQPLDMLQAGLIGFALTTLGVQMSQTRPAPFRAPLLAALGVRLLLSPLLAIGLAMAFGFSRESSASLILAAGAPTAVNVALLSHEFGGDVSFATSAVYYSTLFSLATTTVNLALLRLWLGT